MTPPASALGEEAGWHTTRLRLNGAPHLVRAPVDETLVRTLRQRLGVTSVRETCGLGVCGTCTVLFDGRAASSCLALTAQLQDVEVTTCEGLRGPDGEPGPVQRAFIERGAFQCGFCIPAMTVAVHAAIHDRGCRGVDEVARQLSGNLCRCGSYPQVLEAVGDVLAAGGAPSDRGGAGVE